MLCHRCRRQHSISTRLEVLSQLASDRDAPGRLRSDNDPEFASKAILEWLHDAMIETGLIDPGNLWQNHIDESFNGEFENDCSIVEWFRSRPKRVS